MGGFVKMGGFARRWIVFAAVILLCMMASASLAGTMKLPADLKEIGTEAFRNDKSLGEVFVPEGTTIIRDYAFANSSLTAIHLPAGLKTIGAHAFDGCTGLTIFAPSGTKGLDFARENGISYITELTANEAAEAVIAADGETVLFSYIPEANGYYSFTSEGSGDTYGYLYDADMNVIASNDDSGEENNFSISQLLTAGTQYFFGARYYSSSGTGSFSVRLAVSVTWTIKNDVLTISGKGALEFGSSSPPWPETIRRVVIKSGITSIGAYAFNGCGSIEEFVIPKSVTTIGNNAFSRCISLISISLPNSVTAIGNNAFYYCTSLKSITLPDSVTAIGSYAFYYCTSLKNIAIPASVKSIGSAAFSYCSPTITFKGDAPTFDGDIFSSGDSWSGVTSILAIYPHGNSTWNANTMQNYGADCVIWRADNASTVIADTKKDKTETLNSTTSNTVGSQNYSTWSTIVRTYLIPMSDGGLTRVEYAGGAVVIEQYSAADVLVWKKTISMELPLWGGFYSGANYNFFVFGQNNSNEDDSVEVIRVVRYSKNWHRIDSVSVYGANTTAPFAAGSCRITESGDMLYIHTCHQMYTSSDGLRHQANMHFDIYVPTMAIVQQNYLVRNSAYDYVSHSFNQFVITDGDDVIKVDHGDAYPRSISLMRFENSASSLSNNSGVRITLLSLAGTVGANSTGASVGGLEASSTHYLVAANTIDQSSDSGGSQRNIVILAASKTNFTDSGVSVVRITNYAESAGKFVSTPVLVRISSSRFLLLWTEGTSGYSSASDKVHYCFLSAAGKRTSSIYVSDGKLSGCQPVVQNNKVTWYVTNDSAPVFYTIDLDNPGSISRN